MRVSRKIKMAMVAVPVAAIIAGGYLGHPTDAPRPANAPMVQQQAGVPGDITAPTSQGGGTAGGGKAGGGMHLLHIPHPYLFHRPYLLRRGRY